MNHHRCLAILLAVLLLVGCSREGFEGSLSRENTSLPPESSAESKPTVFGAVYDLEEQTAEGIEGSYQIPTSSSPELDKAVKRIGRSIRGILSELPTTLTKEGEKPTFSLLQEVTRNDGTYFSSHYALTMTVGQKSEVYHWGLVFDSATGADVRLSRLIDPDAFSVFLLDGPSITLFDVEQEMETKQRAYLTEQGSASLGERLTTSDPGDIATLLNTSFYLDGSQLVAVFTVSEELGRTIQAAVRI